MIPTQAQPLACVPLVTERDIPAARLAVTRELDKMGVGSLRKVRFVTAVSEIVRNAVDHGGGGEIHIYALERPRRIAVRCVDSGPGIADIEAAMADGFSTARSMGKGLGGARRLVDQFTIAPRPEGGIIVEMLASV